MTRTASLALAAVSFFALSVPAEAARSRHVQHHKHRYVPHRFHFDGRPAAWCGWYLARHLGLNDRRLWLARKWAEVFPHTSPHVGAVAVWSHHVGVIVGGSAGHWIILSGNDGHRVRTRERSTSRVIAFVEPARGYAKN